MDMTTAYPSKQEIFDAIAYLPAEIEAMYYDMSKVAEKHMADIKSVGFTDEYYDDVAAAAEKHGVKYVNPKYKVGLKPVETRPTLH